MVRVRIGKFMVMAWARTRVKVLRQNFVRVLVRMNIRVNYDKDLKLRQY